MIHLRPTSDWPVILRDLLATDPQLGRDRLELPIWLGKSLYEIKISRVTCDRFTIVPNDIRGHRVIYDQPAKIYDQRRIQLRVGSLASAIDRFHDRFWRLKACRSCGAFEGGACRSQWRVSPSHCECSGVTCDLLVSNIGGTYDLADQLPSKQEFGHFLVVSQSQVPREFGVNLA